MIPPDLRDACPRCFPGDAPAALPVGTPAQTPEGTVTNHACWSCGTAWTTLRGSDGWVIVQLVAVIETGARAA